MMLTPTVQAYLVDRRHNPPAAPDAMGGALGQTLAVHGRRMGRGLRLQNPPRCHGQARKAGRSGKRFPYMSVQSTPLRPHESLSRSRAGEHRQRCAGAARRHPQASLEAMVPHSLHRPFGQPGDLVRGSI